MKLSNAFLMATAALVNISAGSPTTIAEPVSELAERGDTSLVKRGNWADCTINNPNGDSGGNADIWINTWGYWGNDWGKGLLDNLRGQCGGIYGWQFGYVNGDNSKQGTAHFYAYVGDVLKTGNDGTCGGDPFCSSHCIEDAIWLASQGTGAIEGVNCYVPKA
ncbi:hypothetical protein IQ06DRAFT_291297 [Phaeosphaeriaceae sp. SRC1lsM3a]|nr:hypothetical protein IQ06DRAFT_291297 [Stagonospora sp. SRC1lsM3a]